MIKTITASQLLYAIFFVCISGALPAASAERDQTESKTIPRTLVLEIIRDTDTQRNIDANEYVNLINKWLPDPVVARTVDQDRIAVDLGNMQDEKQLYEIRRILGVAGILEFRVTADPDHPMDQSIIKSARNLSADQNEVVLCNRKVARWIPYSVEEFGSVDAEDKGGRRLVKRLAGEIPQVLVLLDPWDVTGEYVTMASKGVDERTGPAVHIRFNRQGAKRMRQLTSSNLPNQATGAARFLGIVFDNKLLSAPSIETAVDENVQISGRNMRENEVDRLVDVLSETSLPTSLREISESAADK
jgi:preprotein translocase subunit SecD